MSANLKSQTIKIDIRAALPGGDSSGSGPRRPRARLFDTLDSHLLLEHSCDAILLADASGQIVGGNTRAEIFFGYEDSGLNGRPLHTLVAGVTDALLDDIRNAVSNGRYMRIQAFAIHRNGEYTAIEAVATGSARRPDAPLCLLIRDTHAQWSLEQKLASFLGALDHLDEGVGLADTRGIVTFANQALARLLNLSGSAALLGRSLASWFDRDKVFEPLLAKIRHNEKWCCELSLVQGAERRLRLHAMPDIGLEGELRGMVVVFSALDAATRQECDRIVAEKLAELCHSMGQPATVLLTSVELLRLESQGEPPERREIVDLCYNAAIQIREQLREVKASVE